MSQSLNQILDIVANDHFQGVNARNLHQALKVGRDFSTWIKSRLQGANFIEEQDFIIVQELRSPKRGSANNEPSSMARPQKVNDYILSIDTAKHICLMERNEIGQAIRQYFINAERALKQIAPEVQTQLVQLWIDSRDEARKPFRQLNDALKRSLEKQGKTAEKRDYIAEIQMLNTIMLGIPPEVWKQEQGFTGNIRDHLTADQLERLAYLEKADEVLLDSGITNFYDRKRRLEQMHRERFGYIASSAEKRQANIQAQIQKLKESVMRGAKR